MNKEQEEIVKSHEFDIEDFKVKPLNIKLNFKLNINFILNEDHCY